MNNEIFLVYSIFNHLDELQAVFSTYELAKDFVSTRHSPELHFVEAHHLDLPFFTEALMKAQIGGAL